MDKDTQDSFIAGVGCGCALLAIALSVAFVGAVLYFLAYGIYATVR